MTTFFAAILRHRFFAACLLGLAVVLPASASHMLPLYLDEIIDRSAVAFEAVCIENRTGRDPTTNMVVTFTTFEVRDALKGVVGPTHVIKQIGGSSPGENLQYGVNGIPKFTVGETYIVFLAGVSSSGFSSPIGLAQGQFTVRMGEAGREVSNGRDFRDMAARLSEKSLAPGLKDAPAPVRQMDIDGFKQLVRDRAGLNQAGTVNEAGALK